MVRISHQLSGFSFKTNIYLTVAENVEFDRGLVHSAMDKAAYLHIKEELRNDIKMEIEIYCKKRGEWWDSLLETVGRVEVKIEENEKKKEKRQARRGWDGKANKQGGKGKKQGGKGKEGSGKEKAKVDKPVEPFVRKDEDFPPLI